MKKFRDKLVFITGGSSGIGLETAKLLAAKGAHIAIFARNAERLNRAQDIIKRLRRSEKQRIMTMQVDVADNKLVKKRMATAVKKFGVPDILIASAGVGHSDSFENITYETFDRIMQINVYGTRNTIAALLPEMKTRGGHIVILASEAGLIGIIGYTAYGTSKFALVGFGECLRGEVKQQGIRVTVVCPPEVETPLVDDEAKTIQPEAKAVKLLAGVLKPETVARSILRGIRWNRFIVVPGFLAKFMYHAKRYSPGCIPRLIADITACLSSRKRL